LNGGSNHHQPIEPIKDLDLQMHGVSYIVTFMVMKHNVLDSNYSMFLSQPWLRNACATHDWGNNLITIKGNGTMQTIVVIKHLDNNTKHPKVLLCYDLTKRITNEKEECRNPTLAKCEDETHTPKVGDWESSGTPECL
jgi:hypothetical protein